jgi:broad specificity phosphatase PhoE
MSVRKNEELRIYLARHGETAWSRTDRRSGLADEQEAGDNNTRLMEEPQ